MTMTALPKSALPLTTAAVLILAVSGCHAGVSASGSGGTSQSPAPAASSPTSQATTAAGSTTTPGASGGNDHPCSVVTEQEASTALGADPGPGQETPPGAAGAGQCVYGAGPSVVRVTVDASGVGKAIYDGDRSTVTGINPALVVDVTGVGNGAFETPSGATEATVYLYKGNTFVEITLGTTTTTGPPKDQVIALATTAAGRV
jgi:hypothetical protein